MRKAALVTGSNSGIGLAIARQLIDAGHDVAINSFTDRPEDHALAKELAGSSGAKVIYLGADMAKPGECRELVERARDAFGRIDVLVNNAGIQFVAPVEEFPQERWDAIIAVNLSAVFHTTAAALPFMKSAGAGRIINIASAHGLRASPNKSAYVAAKHGVVGFTKTVALEVAGSGITCNAICPGYVRTPLVEKQIEDLALAHPELGKDGVARELILQKQPSKQFATVEQIGAAAVFLASDAAGQITGTTLSIDGGWTAQ